MSALKRVCRFDVWIDPVFDAMLGEERDITLEVGDLHGPETAIEAMLARAHVFHVSPARDELPTCWHVTDALLARCPNLLSVSSGGAGFDTVDAAACTRAGVALVHQVGGNARSVAELAIGLMLAVSRKICVSDRPLGTECGFTHEARRKVAAWAAGQIIGLLRGERPARLFNPEVWPAVLERRTALFRPAG